MVADSKFFTAELMANQSWDSLTLDMQHGVIDYPDALGMLQAISSTDVVPMVRWIGMNLVK